MLTVEDYGVIRRAHRDGMSIRAIARKFRHSRRKVRDAMAAPEPQPYTRTKERDAPKLGPFKPVIDQGLADDEQAPPKQRHTAMQVFRRLRDGHHYPGGYDQVRRYISGLLASLGELGRTRLHREAVMRRCPELVELLVTLPAALGAGQGARPRLG